jgi:hypothetical protein
MLLAPPWRLACETVLRDTPPLSRFADGWPACRADRANRRTWTANPCRNQRHRSLRAAIQGLIGRITIPAIHHISSFNRQGHFNGSGWRRTRATGVRRRSRSGPVQLLDESLEIGVVLDPADRAARRPWRTCYRKNAACLRRPPVKIRFCVFSACRVAAGSTSLTSRRGARDHVTAG